MSFVKDFNGGGSITTRDGYYLQAYRIENGELSDELSEINFANLFSSPKATTRIQYSVNLNADQEVTGNVFDASTYDSAQRSSSFEIFGSYFDQLGALHDLATFFVKTDLNVWSYYILKINESDATQLQEGVLYFDENGNLERVEDSFARFEIDFGQLSNSNISTQYANPFFAYRNFWNGHSVGSLRSVSFNKLGRLEAHFSNGDNQVAYQIPLAHFSEPSRLKALSESLYVVEETEQSGEAKISILESLVDEAILSFVLDDTYKYEELPNMVQGALKDGKHSTDLAIVGPGFFLVKDKLTSETYYTRLGEFNIDSRGVLIGKAGAFTLMGYQFVDGMMSSRLSEINLAEVRLDSFGQRLA